MAIGHINIGKTEFTFVFRHYWEKYENEVTGIIEKMTTWRELELGLFYRRIQIVGKKNFNKPKEWSKNLVYEYMLGINLILCKAWFTVNRGGMNLNINP